MLPGIILLSSCQSFPRGIQITELDETFPTIEQFYSYYSMCRAVTKERETWRDTGWELDYFSHEPTNTLALAVIEHGVLHMVFRSSQAPKQEIDTRINYQFRPAPLFFTDNPSYKAHRGMLSKYEGIYDDVHNRINSFAGEEILLIGHSAGGMVAYIAFFDIYHAYPELGVRLVTFGTPRVLTRNAAAQLREAEDRIIRIVMGRDIFSSMPPAILGYRHVGTLVRMGDQPFWKPFSVSDHYPGYQHEFIRLYEEYRSSSSP